LLTTREIIILCQKIAESKNDKTRVPEWILTILKTIIDRRSTAAVFHSTLLAVGRPNLERSNVGHAHFIDVLQQAHSILSAAASRITRRVKQAPSPADAPLDSRFKHLTTEEPSELQLTEDELEQLAADIPHVNFRVEGDNKQESLNQLLCILADMKKVCQEVEATFEQYLRGEVFAEVACMVADTGFGIIHQTRQRFVDQRPKFREYFDMLKFLGLDSRRHQSLIFVFPTGKYQESDAATPATPNLTKPTVPVCSEISSLLCPTGAVMMTNLHNVLKGAADNQQTDERAQSRHGFEQILHNAIPELQQVPSCYADILVPEFGLWHGDEFLSGLFDFLFDDKKCLPIWLAVVAQSYRNIYDILGGHMTFGAETDARRWAGLKERINSFRRFVYCKGRTSSFQPNDSWSDWFNYITSKKIVPLLGPAADREDALKVHMSGKTTYAGAPTYLVANLPTVAGGLMITPMLTSYRDEWNIANINLVVHSAAHLYAACDYTGLITEDLRWHDMEFFLEHHKMVTDTPPGADPFVMVSHFHIALGVRGRTLAKARADPYNLNLKSVRSICGKSKLANEFVNVLHNSHETGRTFFDIHNKDGLMDVLANADRSTSDKQAKSGEPQPKAYTPIGLLSIFKRHLIKDEPQLNFNMIAFSQQCSIFMEEARSQVNNVIQQDMSDVSPAHVTNNILAHKAELLDTGTQVSHPLLPVVWKALGDALTVPRDEFSRDAYARSSGHLSSDNKPRLPPVQASAPTDRLFYAFVRECLSKSENWVPEDNSLNTTVFQIGGDAVDRSGITAMYNVLQRWEKRTRATTRKSSSRKSSSR
jgi:hypothetical protein